jgi:hypothetical protein
MDFLKTLDKEFRFRYLTDKVNGKANGKANGKTRQNFVDIVVTQDYKHHTSQLSLGFLNH